jgi:hypothetical protein
VTESTRKGGNKNNKNSLKDNKKRIEKQATRVGNSFIVVERVIH